jgi:hypothetical protein
MILQKAFGSLLLIVVQRRPKLRDRSAHCPDSNPNPIEPENKQRWKSE